jgi:parallel beta-helix repeat protein
MTIRPRPVLLALLLPVFLAASRSAPAATYYVATQGNDLNPGTAASPWRTIQKAAGALLPGDTVLIRQGTYQETVAPARSGAGGNSIVYRNYEGEEVVIDGQNRTHANCVLVNGKAYLQFIGLTLTGASGAALDILGASHDITLDGLKCRNSRFGIRAKGELSPITSVTVRNCDITANSKYGIFFYKKVYDSTIGPNNHIYSNGGEDQSYGIEISTDYPGVQADGARNIVMHDNEVDHNDVQGIQTWNSVGVLIAHNYFHHHGATGIQIENGSANIIVQDNVSEYNAQTWEYETGAWIDDTHNAVVSGNTFRGNKIGLMVTSSTRVILRNNVIVDNNRGVPNLYNAMGVNVNMTSYDVAVVHNTLHGNGAPESSKGGISMGSKPPVSGILFKNNILSETHAPYDLYYGTDGYTSDFNLLYNMRQIAVYWQGAKRSWSQYLASSGQEAHSIVKQPGFVDVTNQDFHLGGGSPGIDAGDCLARTVGSGTGQTIRVTDAGYFSDGFGMTLGDLVRVGENEVRIKSVDYGAKTITVDRQIEWKDGDGVSYPYVGRAPDMGAYEASSGMDPPTELRVIR